MKKTIVNVFKGLTPQYYFRQLFFGALIFGLFIFLFTQTGSKHHNNSYGLLIIGIINTILYPYSRFAYERVIGFIMGDNVFFVNAIFMLIAKFITIYFCWGLAIFIAPVGLLFIYFYQKKS